jgi:flagellar basal body-associated protein FliL
MPWVLVDILIGVLAVLVFGAVALALFRHVKSFTRSAKAAGARVGAVTAEIDAIQSESAARRTP